ncbi:large conductance mechanosensitive channel protein MscL [Modestobacter sp. NPDC049651]|uniref:large conductance mechanosensitive channel protein MscL n=1 Tax=unclassified Modestobacter TaxID=2643866 RepID=UPI0033DA4CCA
MLKGFKDFLLRGNVVDLAVAVVIGAAFSAVVQQFTESFLNPLIAVFTGTDEGRSGASFSVAGQDFAYGDFIGQVIRFAITAAVVYFLVVLPMRRLVHRRATNQEPGPSGPSEVELLVEIRDLLRGEQGRPPAPEPEARHRA